MIDDHWTRAIMNYNLLVVRFAGDLICVAFCISLLDNDMGYRTLLPVANWFMRAFFVFIRIALFIILLNGLRNEGPEVLIKTWKTYPKYYRRNIAITSISPVNIFFCYSFTVVIVVLSVTVSVLTLAFMACLFADGCRNRVTDTIEAIPMAVIEIINEFVIGCNKPVTATQVSPEARCKTVISHPFQDGRDCP